MTLSSGISKKFKSRFLLEEDDLRRIEGILAKAQSSYQEPLLLVYHVEREDDRFFQTHEIDEVLADPNVKNRRISLIGVGLENAAQSTPNSSRGDSVVSIWFNTNEHNAYFVPPVEIRISSPNRTWALLLADELEPQITRIFKVKSFPTWALLLPASLLAYGIYRLTIALGVPPTKSATLGVIGTMLIASLVSIFMYLSRANVVAPWLFKNFSGSSHFLWGDEPYYFAKREKLRSNLFWVIFIGFFVSLLAGIATLGL